MTGLSRYKVRRATTRARDSATKAAHNEAGSMQTLLSDPAPPLTPTSYNFASPPPSHPLASPSSLPPTSQTFAFPLPLVTSHLQHQHLASSLPKAQRFMPQKQVLAAQHVTNSMFLDNSSSATSMRICCGSRGCQAIGLPRNSSVPSPSALLGTFKCGGTVTEFPC
ncbi:hypothetical protein PHYPSEUDO_012653 [Phytophthora pseudosyringae]|uniref:Uncharacterized protein n=1 Tax=Phytophthora pseudosyringae TaxID=221518 RepID=A0A8T1V950_9STRA|nr:hypothetical protein PHYPSEUDO_012653 [Phytophthora pseudosyringae]